jgi:hypothetical protein
MAGQAKENLPGGLKMSKIPIRKFKEPYTQM